MSTGKGSKSIRKSQQGIDLLPAVGFINTVAKHKATVNQTVINVGSLTVPTEATSLGFIQPSGGTLAAIDLQRFKNNVSLRSSVRGVMDNPIDYQITGTQQITLSAPALENEIFTIVIESRPATTVQMVAAQPKVESYTLPAGQTDIPTGPYTVNKNPAQRVGDFMVFVDRELMYRNDGNSAWSSGIVGDYQELAGLIRMNFADLANDRDVVLVWVGALVDNPQDTQLALVQTLQGQIDSMIPVLAAVSGLPTTAFQTSPNDVDLLNFSAQVLDHESRIDALENEGGEIINGFYNALQSILNNTATILNKWSLRYQSTSKATLSNNRITFNVAGKFSLSGCFIIQGATASLAGAASTFGNFLHKNSAGVSQANYHMAGFGGQHASTININVAAGDYVEIEVFQNTGAPQNTGVAANHNHFTCAYLGD